MDNKNVDFIYEKADQMYMNFGNLEKDLLLREVSEVDVDDMSAKQAYDYLYDLKKRAGEIFDN